MEWNAKSAEFITGATLPMQHLLDKRGLLKYTQGQKRSTGRDKLYDFTGLYSLALIVAMRHGKPAQNVPPLSYETIKPIMAYVNSLSAEQITAAAQDGYWLIFGPPDCPPQIVDVNSWQPGETMAWFWIGWPVDDVLSKLQSNIAAYERRKALMAA